MKKSNLIYYIATFLVFFFMITFDVFANCPLGPDVTKDLYNVLNVMKIAAPLLCVVLSIYDAIRAVAKGDPATDMKAVAKKFGKRMIYTIILFFIPVLVDICFQMADVWDANGTCDLSKPEDNGFEQNGNSTNTVDMSGPTELESKCWGIDDKDECLLTEGCDWVLDINDAPKYVLVKKCDAEKINNTICYSDFTEDTCKSQGMYNGQSACLYDEETNSGGHRTICYRNPEYIKEYRQPWLDYYNEHGVYPWME